MTSIEGPSASPGFPVASFQMVKKVRNGEGRLRWSNRRYWAANRAYWAARACGSQNATAPQGTVEYFEQADRVRYTKEPVAEFADYGSRRGSAVLEVGTGMGGDLARFLKGGVLATGVDLSPTAIEVTRRRLELEGLPRRLVRATALSLPFRDGVFDMVWSWGVLHHTIEIERAVEEVRRVLRPGGSLHIMLYHRPSWVALAAWGRWALLRGRPFQSLRRVVAENVQGAGTMALTRKEIRQLLRDFENVQVRVIGTFWDRKFVPLLGALAGSRMGWFALVTAVKRGGASSVQRGAQLELEDQRSLSGQQ